jgi:UDP-glucose 4-epimerase
VCLRYFNVYGRGQRYDAYGNVIPIFADRLLRGIPLIIYGDGEQTRDFVNARDVAEANIAAAFSDGAAGAFNIGSATRVTINRLAALMQRAAGVEAHLEHAPPRPGDVRDSLAAVDAAREAFDYRATVDLNDGLVEYMEWIKSDPVTLRRLEAEVSR